MAILAAVLIPTVTNKIQDANEGSAVSTCGSYATSIVNDLAAIDAGLKNSLDVLATSSTSSLDNDLAALEDIEGADDVAATVPDALTKTEGVYIYGENGNYTVIVIAGKRAAQCVVTAGVKGAIVTAEVKANEALTFTAPAEEEGE